MNCKVLLNQTTVLKQTALLPVLRNRYELYFWVMDFESSGCVTIYLSCPFFLFFFFSTHALKWCLLVFLTHSAFASAFLCCLALGIPGCFISSTCTPEWLWFCEQEHEHADKSFTVSKRRRVHQSLRTMLMKSILRSAVWFQHRDQMPLVETQNTHGGTQARMHMYTFINIFIIITYSMYLLPNTHANALMQTPKTGGIATFLFIYTHTYLHA